MDFTSTALIASVKRRGFLPRGSGLTDADILLYLSDELRTYIPSFLKSIREEYLIASLDIAVTSGTVAAPARAVGAALRTVEWLTASNPRNLDRVEPERVPSYSGASGEPVAYWLQGNNLILLPAPTSGTLRLTYQQRPGQLVPASACAIVTAYGGDAFTLIVNARPSTMGLGDLVDLVAAVPNFELKGMDMVVSGIGSTTLQFSTAVPADWAVGDYFCVAGETPIPQMPQELHDLLAQATAYKIAQATGSSRSGEIKEGLKDLRDQMTVLLSPRVDGSARPIVNRVGVGARRWWGW